MAAKSRWSFNPGSSRAQLVKYPTPDLSNSNSHRRSTTKLYPVFGWVLASAFILLAGTNSAAVAIQLPPQTHPRFAPRAVQMAHSRPADSSADHNHQESDSTGVDDAPYTTGLVSATYFVNWAIYGRSHFPWQIPFKSVTHVFYAFANVNSDSGEVYLSDSWADEQIHWADRGDSWNDQGNNLYGCFNQFRQLKKQHRHLKLLISIGGWTYSSNFGPGTNTPAKRQKFADSALSILENYGLDGIDIDWEYPTNDKEADQLVDVLRRTRTSLDDLKRKQKDDSPYLLTIAAPCGPVHYKQLHLKEMKQYLSFISLMAYDFAGSWDTIAGHQANLHNPGTMTVNQGNFSTAEAVKYYVSQSVPASKLVIGMPLYGRSFMNTKGIGHPYNGIGQGTWEAGVYDYKAIPKDNVKVVADTKVVGAYTYNPSTQELITFDNPATVRQKIDYVRHQNLGGVMWWESSSDKSTPGEALIPLAASLLGKLDTLANHLHYPNSKWDNLKNNHPQAASDNGTVGYHRGPIHGSWTQKHQDQHQDQKHETTKHNSHSKAVRGSY